MSWAKIDDQWWCHPKVMGLSGAAAGLWARAISYSCMRRSAVVPTSFVDMTGHTPADVDELVVAGLWIEGPGGFTIHDWHDYQERSLSEKRAEAGRKGGEKSRKSTQEPDKTEATRKQTASKTQANGSNRQATSKQTGKQVSEAQAEAKEVPDGTSGRKRDLLFESVTEACGWDVGSLTRDARGRVNAAVKQLRELGASSDDVSSVARVYRRKWPELGDPTPQALTGNWAALKPSTPAARGPTCPDCGRGLDGHDDELCADLKAGY